MSHSGWETKTVAENVGSQKTNWKCEHDDGVICVVCFSLARRDRDEALMKLDKLEAEAAGMRAALEAIKREPYGCPMCDSGELRDANKSHWDSCGYPKMWAALSGDAGKEISREMDRLKDTIDLKDVALQSAIGGLKASKIEIELIEHERDEARANMEVLKSQLAEERGMNLNGKIADREQYQMVVDQRTEERDAALRDREDLQKRLSALNDQLLEASQQAVDAKAKLAEANDQHIRDFNDQGDILRAKLAEKEREIENWRIAHFTTAEGFCEYKHKWRELKKQLAEIGCCCSENIQEAIRARGKG